MEGTITLHAPSTHQSHTHHCFPYTLSTLHINLTCFSNPPISFSFPFLLSTLHFFTLTLSRISSLYSSVQQLPVHMKISPRISVFSIPVSFSFSSPQLHHSVILSPFYLDDSPLKSPFTVFSSTITIFHLISSHLNSESSRTSAVSLHGSKPHSPSHLLDIFFDTFSSICGSVWSQFLLLGEFGHCCESRSQS